MEQQDSINPLTVTPMQGRLRRSATTGSPFSNSAIDFFLTLGRNLRVLLQSEGGTTEGMKRWFSGIPTTSVERSSGLFDVRFRLGVEAPPPLGSEV